MKVRCCNCGFVEHTRSPQTAKCIRCKSSAFERVVPLDSSKNESSSDRSMLLTEVPEGRSNLMG